MEISNNSHTLERFTVPIAQSENDTNSSAMIGELPMELLNSVFSHLSYQQRCAIYRVSKVWILALSNNIEFNTFINKSRRIQKLIDYAQSDEFIKIFSPFKIKRGDIFSPVFEDDYADIHLVVKIHDNKHLELNVYLWSYNGQNYCKGFNKISLYKVSTGGKKQNYHFTNIEKRDINDEYFYSGKKYETGRQLLKDNPDLEGEIKSFEENVLPIYSKKIEEINKNYKKSKKNHKSKIKCVIS